MTALAFGGMAVYGDWLVLTLFESAGGPDVPDLAALIRDASAEGVGGVRVDVKGAQVGLALTHALLHAEEAARRRGWRFRLNGVDTILPLDGAAAAHDWGGGWTGIAPIRVGAATDADLAAALVPPYRGFFELDGDGGLASVGQRCFDAVRSGGLALSVSTRTAYALDLAQVFDQAVFSRGWRDDGDSGALMALCLGEAIGNAVIHGNLGIGGGMRSCRSGFENFRALLAERLRDDARMSWRVEVSLHALGEVFRVVVADRGGGFDADAKLREGDRAEALQGRGLNLMRKAVKSMWYEDGGRAVVLEYAFHVL